MFGSRWYDRRKVTPEDDQAESREESVRIGRRWHDRRKDTPEDSQSESCEESVRSSKARDDEPNSTQRSKHDPSPSPGTREIKYEGKYYEEGFERIANSFATSFENRLNMDADAEENFSRQRKRTKQLEAAKKAYRDC